jgi:hypothetical protein
MSNRNEAVRPEFIADNPESPPCIERLPVDSYVPMRELGVLQNSLFT